MASTTNKIPLEIRPILPRSDMPEILAIERAGFEFPWQAASFFELLRQRNVLGLIVEDDERIVGYAIYELAGNNITILNIAVSPKMRRLGIGSVLVGRFVKKLSLQKRSRLLVQVRETNLVAQMFFRACGFRAVRIVRDCYDETDEDGYLMRYGRSD